MAKEEKGIRERWKSLKENFSYQHFKEAFFSLKVSPQKKALSFAVGILIAFNPTLGLHTVEVFLAVWLFRLNFPLVFAGAWVNNPWTVVPFYTFCYFVGRWVMKPFGIEYDPHAVHRLVHTLVHAGWRDWLTTLPPIIMHEGVPFVVGSMLVAVVAAVITYFVSLAVLIRFEKRKGKGLAPQGSYKA